MGGKKSTLGALIREIKRVGREKQDSKPQLCPAILGQNKTGGTVGYGNQPHTVGATESRKNNTLPNQGRVRGERRGKNF